MVPHHWETCFATFPMKLFKFDEINENLDLLRKGDIVGRAVMKF